MSASFFRERELASVQKKSKSEFIIKRENIFNISIPLLSTNLFHFAEDLTTFQTPLFNPQLI